MRKIGVQHHLQEAIGMAFDDTGYGTDGTIWGGEFLYASRTGFRRLGCFKPFRLPGGESAVRSPIRIALALLAEILPESSLEGIFLRSGLSSFEIQTLLAMLTKDINCPLTSSLGRIFDAASALLGLVKEVSYEGEGPIRLEGMALKEYGGDSLEATFKAAFEASLRASSGASLWFHPTSVGIMTPGK